MGKFAAIPNDVLEEIFLNMRNSPADLCLIRSTCQSIRIAVDPILFREVVLQYRKENLNKLAEKLEALAHGNCTNIIDHARTLTIRLPLSESNEVLLRMKEVLSSAIAALKGVTTVIWNIKFEPSALPLFWFEHHGIFGELSEPVPEPGETDWVKDEIITGLSAITGFSSLNMQINGSLTKDFFSSHFHLISSQINELSISHNSYYGMSSSVEVFLESAPTLTNLKKLSADGHVIIIGDITRPHFRNLTSLCIQNGQDPVVHERNIQATWSDDQATVVEPENDIWRGLINEKIWLAEIFIDKPTHSLILYLNSYSGLERMTITGGVSYTFPASNAIATRFYELALWKHVTTLTVLEIEPMNPVKWVFGTHNVDLIRSLVNLRRLSVALLPDVSRFTNDARELIATACSLSSLKSLKITVLCLNETLLKEFDVGPTIEEFGPLGPSQCQLVIEAGPAYFINMKWKWYMLMKNEDSGGYWFKLFNSDV